MDKSELGKCPKCGSTTWIETTTWRWMVEETEYVCKPGTAAFQFPGVALGQDGECELEFRCEVCGFELEDVSSVDEWRTYWYGEGNQDE
jgi:hypothetical protein